MRLARGAARVAILVAVVLLVQFIVLPASATSYDLNGSAECVALGGVWSIGCTFSSLTVASGDTLTIATLVAVEITGSLVVDGTLDNLGGILIDNTATVTINGAFENEEVFETYGSVTVNTGGSFYNVGSSPGFTNEAGAYFNILGNLENGPPGTMNNDGAMVIGTSGEIANYGTISSLYGSLTTYGELYNDATFYNGGWLNAAFSGSIYNDVSGTLDNLIVINVTSTLYNLGALESLASSVINVGSGATAGYLGNDGSIQNAGSYVITANGELDNYEDLDNTGGTIANVGLVLNECTATVENAAGVSPDPVQYVPCAPEILGYTTTTSSTGLPSTAYTVFGLSNLYSGGGNPLLIKLYEDGATLLGSNLTSDAAGSWSITTPPLAAGDDVLYATATDAQDIVSLPSSPFTVAVVVDTSIGVACSPTSLDVGTPTTCTATVTELGGGPPTTPTGTVDWSDPGGTFSSTTCTLSPNGVTAEAGCTTNYVPGSGSEGSPIYVTGDFIGSTYYYGSTSDTSISSTKLGSTTGLTCVPLVLTRRARARPP